jgi:ubiquinone/menaquinone biosynthesis C-methylase UbiE
MESRKEREKIFHDRLSTQGNRGHAVTFYTITSSIKEYYTRFLEERCPGKQVLEIGCGPGGRACDLAEMGAFITGIDISEEAVKKAQAKAEQRHITTARFEVMDAEALSFPDNFFDIVFGGGVLHHLNIERAYREIARVLKPNGEAIFIEPLAYNPLVRLYRKLTPSLRSADEHPLLERDIEMAQRYFQTVNIRYYYLISLLGIPFAGVPVVKYGVGLLEALDRLVFSFIPSTRKYAWMCTIVLGHPRRHSTRI